MMGPRTLLAAGVLVLELCQVVDIFVDDNPQVIGLAALSHIGLRKRSRHFEMVDGLREAEKDGRSGEVRTTDVVIKKGGAD